MVLTESRWTIHRERVLMQLSWVRPCDLVGFVLQLLEVLTRCKLKARLTEARERMHKLFPLNEKLWIDWINDSMAAISTQEDVDALKQLFQQATQDYVSVNIWESYLQ